MSIPNPTAPAEGGPPSSAGSSAAESEPRPSRYGRRRAVLLLSVYVLMAVHVVHWKLTGRTLAPLELNEVMVTLELGVVTAGFLFMAAAVLSALVFGRFFCSWGCHILALEDLCAWLLERIGVRPKPVRSRALLLVPLLSMLYMFVWPQVERWLAGRPLPEIRVQGDEAGWASFVTDDFWRNLPPVGVALLTFAVCGFLIVYVLGTRSFCRYACPYGAAFALADRLAPGRIVARPGCTGCGRCTAACQSDIRVHEELAAYGTVKSSSCLKDLDCVSACPSGAVAYGFTVPALFRARTEKKAPRRSYDFTLAEDAALAALFLASLLAFRGLYGVVPFLLSLGIAAILAYVGVVAGRLVRRPSVKAGRTQLKAAGRWTRSGLAFGGIALALGVLLAHSATVQANRWLGERAAARVRAGSAADLAPALARLERVERWGLLETPRVRETLAELYFVAGTPRRAAPYLQELLARRPDDVHARLSLARSLHDAGRTDEAEREIKAALAGAQDEEGSAHGAELRGEAQALRGALRAAAGDVRGALEAYGAAQRERPDDPAPHRALAELLARTGELASAADHLERAVALAPSSAPGWYNLAVLRAQLGREPQAIAAYREAARLAPQDADTWNNLGFLLARGGAFEEAEGCLRRAVELAPAHAHAHFNLGALLQQQGRADEGALEVERAARLDPRYAEFLAER